MPDKIQIDPAHPIASLTAGDQQFTIGADTNHRKSSISGVVVPDIPEMGRNGVRHIMIEYPMDSLETLTKKYPDMAQAKTWQERRDVLEKESQRIFDKRQSIMGAALKDIDQEKEPEKWKAVADKAYNDAEDATEVERITLRSAELDLHANEVLEGTYSQGPGRWSDDQIRERTAEIFPSNVDDPKQAASNFAGMLIESRKANIQVHFTGDRPDPEVIANTNIAGRALEYHNEVNKKYSDQYDMLTTKAGYAIPPEDKEGFIKYVDEARRLTDDLNAKMMTQMSLRDDAAHEQARVDRIIEAANGEKSYIQWGAAHSFKKDDFNERLDATTAKQAAGQGKSAPEKTKVIELCDSEADHLDRNVEDRPDEPDARLFIKEKKVEITPSGAASLELKSGSQASLQQEAIAEQYAKLMGSNVVGSIKSGPQSDTAESATPAQQIRATPSYTA